MVDLETFPARSRLARCGTCEAWSVRRKPGSRTSGLWCPRLGTFLPEQDLTAQGCQAWRQEPRETFAVELYEELIEEGAQ